MKFLDIIEAGAMLGMSQSTFQRRLKSKNLTPDEGERLIKIYQLTIIKQEKHLFDNKLK